VSLKKRLFNVALSSDVDSLHDINNNNNNNNNSINLFMCLATAIKANYSQAQNNNNNNNNNNICQRQALLYKNALHQYDLSDVVND
jgi:hypothetical protein